jgi:hypothetical protein
VAIKSGFFNSLAGDRKYDAEDINKFFDGVITDGILEVIGDTFLVVPSSGMQIASGSGKAWFLKSWIENTSDAFRTLADSDVTYDRIDIVALDFDKSDQVRANDIVIVEGTPAGSPVPPTLIDTPTHLQKPLAHIFVGANETVIDSGDITDKVGTVDCPFSSGIVDLIIEVDDVTIQIAGNELSVKNLGIDTTQLAADAVTGAKIGDDQINSEHYASLSVDRGHLANDIIDGTKIANDVINSEHYVTGSIDNEHIADDAINSEHYANASIDTAHLSANAVDDTKVGNRVPMFTRRRGGDPNNWFQSGTTIYTPTAVKMQCGCVSLGSISGGASAQVVVTFPQAFASGSTPIIFLQSEGNGWCNPIPWLMDNEEVTILSRNHDTGGHLEVVSWLAIGPE